MIVETQAKEQNHPLLNWNQHFLSSLVFLEQLEIATLGPSGTSSEASAQYLLSSLKNSHGKYSLFPTYEEAYENLVSGTSNILLVANAYKGIDKFYMSKDIQFATHHAPSCLLPWFLADFDMKYEVLFVNSTSEAAIKLQKGEVDLCLTTVNAAQKYNVEFISPTCTILMLWSVFGKKSTIVSFKL
ncbi:hypothetical protein GBG21_09305 [Aeribacillus pallidus]